MMTRSEFLNALGATSALTLAGCKCPFCSPRPKVALQLWSINEILFKDVGKNFAALKSFGYDGVEFYDFNGMGAKTVKKILADTGLAGAGVHVNGDVALVGENLRKTLDFCAEAGIESVTTPHASRKTAEEYRAFGRQMGEAAEVGATYDIPVGIHTTYHHFTTKFDGETAWEWMFKDASPKLQQQIDFGNTFHTGEDVVALLKKYRGRHFSVHAKENEPTVDGTFLVPPTDGGTCIPWNDIIAVLKDDPSVRWWIIEAEGKSASLEPAEKCCRILRDMI